VLIPSGSLHSQVLTMYTVACDRAPANTHATQNTSTDERAALKRVPTMRHRSRPHWTLHESRLPSTNAACHRIPSQSDCMARIRQQTCAAQFQRRTTEMVKTNYRIHSCKLANSAAERCSRHPKSTPRITRQGNIVTAHPCRAGHTAGVRNGTFTQCRARDKQTNQHPPAASLGGIAPGCASGEEVLARLGSGLLSGSSFRLALSSAALSRRSRSARAARA